MNIVLQVGTANSRAGIAGERDPRIKTESVNLEADARPHNEQESELFGHRSAKGTLLAHHADQWRSDLSALPIFDFNWQDSSRRLGLTSSKPIRENYCRLVGELASEVREGNQCNILFLEAAFLAPHERTALRSMLCEFAFDELGASGIYFLSEATASCYSLGRSSGVVVDSGHNRTTITTVHQGYQHKAEILKFGGNIFSAELQNLLKERELDGSLDYRKGRDQQFEILCKDRMIQGLKQAFLTTNPDVQYASQVELQLPDKQRIIVDRTQLAEPLAHYVPGNPKYFRFPTNYRGIAPIVADQAGQEQLAPILSQAIILTGGHLSSSYLSNQIAAKIQGIASRRYLPDFNCLEATSNSAWIGGSLMSHLPTFGHFWISVKDWREGGMAAVLKKCA